MSIDWTALMTSLGRADDAVEEGLSHLRTAERIMAEDGPIAVQETRMQQEVSAALLVLEDQRVILHTLWMDAYHTAPPWAPKEDA